jgi:hypothetical protein
MLSPRPVLGSLVAREAAGAQRAGVYQIGDV